LYDGITGTDPIENAAFPLLRSRLGSDHIENISRVVCLATVITNVSTITGAKGGKVPNLLGGYMETNTIHNRTTVHFVLEDVDKK
jgi:hypothetical protein